MVDYKSSFSDRIAKKNQTAENKCIEHLNKIQGLKWCRFGFDGWDIPKFDFCKLPKEIRNKPDFICITGEPFFLESKGFKGSLKIKEEDIESYLFWNNLIDLYFFAYDCINNKYHILSYEALIKRLQLPEAEKGIYPDNNKVYYKLYLK